MYTTFQMFGVSKYLMPTKAALIWSKMIKSRIITIFFFFFYFNIFKNVIYSCDGKAVFSTAINPAFMSWSSRNYLNMQRNTS